MVRELPDHQTFVIPVRLDDCEVLSDVLRDIQRVDLFPSWEFGITRIISALRGLPLSAPEERAPAPGPAAARRGEVTDLLRDALALNVLPRRNYVPRLLAGACLVGVVVAVIIVLFDTLHIDTRDYPWEGPAEGAIALVTTLALVLLASGAVRWRLAAQVRRQIVASNELVRQLFADHHPFVYRLILGNRAWQAFRGLLYVVLTATAVCVLLFLAVAGGLGRSGERGGMLFFFLVATAPCILVVATFRHIHRVWRSYQEKAGVPEM